MRTRTVVVVLLAMLPAAGSLAEQTADSAPAPAAAQPAGPAAYVPIPPMTAYDIPLERPRVSYTAGRLTLDSDNTTLGEALAAVGRETGIVMDATVAGPERFAIHTSGTEGQVLDELLRDAPCGYLVAAASADPSLVQKVVLSRLEAADTAHKAVTASSARPTPDRVAMYVPPESVAERRGETVLDITKPAPDQDSTPDEAALPPPAAIPAAGAEGKPAEAAARAGDKPPADDQKVNASGRYMQELYKARLQQQQQQEGGGSPASAPNP